MDFITSKICFVHHSNKSLANAVALELLINGVLSTYCGSGLVYKLRLRPVFLDVNFKESVEKDVRV